jgi:uncharacterized membrane protein YecN with MAPEG domain
MLIVTTTIACLLSLFFVRLTFNVINLRRKLKVSLGTGGHDSLERAIRAHGNFAEYVPMSLLLLACLEFNSAPGLLVWALGIALLAGRVVHAIGINAPSKGASMNRVRGMVVTLSTLMALAFCNLGWMVYQLSA